MGLVQCFSKCWKDFLRKFFGESSIHCFPYVVRRDFHMVERIVWFGTLMFSMLCACHVFAGQLKRYNESPTVLSIEMISQGEFERPSFTICSNYTNHERAEELVEELWNIKPSAAHYQLYLDLIKTVSNTNYKNMNNFQRFANVSDFNEIDYLMIAREMKKNVPLASNYFTRVITEMGICQSSTKFYKLLNPFFKEGEDFPPDGKFDTCNSLEICRTSVSPNNVDSESFNKIYINSFDEVMSGDSYDYEVVYGTKIIEKVLKVDDMVSDVEVIELNPKSRKCLFKTEPQTNYFDTYTINLCKMGCRINQALRICRCVPFFYAVRNVRVCGIDGMICLANTTAWYDTSNCKCPSLCEAVFLTKIYTKEQDLHFDRMLTIDLIFPQSRIRREVLFNFDDLIVGFGGSFALFLGFSFLTGIELIYFAIEFVVELAINLIKSHTMSVHQISVPEKQKLSTRA